MTRSATFEDFPNIISLAERKAYPDYPWQDPQQSGLAFLRNLLESDDWQTKFDLLVADEGGGELSGFLLLNGPRVNQITGDSDSAIHDFRGSGDAVSALIERAVEIARGQGSHFLTVDVAIGDDTELLESLDFYLESYRLSVPSGTPELPENSPYEVRQITADDAFPIGVLAATMLGHTLSGERDYDLSELTFRSLSYTTELVARQDPDLIGLLLTLGGDMVGYLLLRLDGHMGYVADVAVEQEHWGGTAVRHLVKSGSRLLHERGIPWYVGDISAANTRALGSAQRSMDFVPRSQRYGRRL